jgi:hypothetical protein
MAFGATKRTILIACLYAVGFGLGGILLVQHWVHVPYVLPYLIFLGCPLMHVFMHHGHGGHAHRHGDKVQPDEHA